MLLSHFLNPRTGPANNLFHPTRNEGLDQYVEAVLHHLTTMGYEVADSNDFLAYANRQPAAPPPGSRLHAYFNAAAEAWHKGDKGLWAQLNDSVRGLNGFAHKAEKIVYLSTEQGLIEKTAREMGLDTYLLKKAGLNDQHIHAYIALHEAAHVMGNDTHPGDQSFTFGEMQAHALSMAQFMEAGGFDGKSIQPRLVAAILNYNTMSDMMTGRGTSHAYQWVDAAFHWVAGNWDQREQFWNHENFTFKPEAFAQFGTFGSDKGRDTLERPFGLAGDTLRDVHDRQHYSVLSATIAELQARPYTQEIGQAVFLLERFGETLKTLAPFARRGSAVHTACMRCLDPSELHVIPTRDDRISRPPALGADLTATR